MFAPKNMPMDERYLKLMQNNPYFQVGQNALAEGTSTAPTSGAGGIARVLQGVLGGLAMKNMGNKYFGAADSHAKALAEETGKLGGGGGAGLVNPMQAGRDMQSGKMDVASALMGPQQPAPQMAAPQGGMGGPAGNPTQPGLSRLTPPLRANSPVSRSAPNGTNGRNLDAITAATESNNRDYVNGRPVTSPKGARFAMQVMPGTARSPGFGLRPADPNNADDMNRLGREYRAKMEERYGGDLAKMWAAYNAGPGRVDAAVAKHGQNWLSAMPAETKAYVAKNLKAVGQAAPISGTTGQAPAASADVPQWDAPEMPALPDRPNRPAPRENAQSGSLELGRALLARGDQALMSQGMALVEEGLKEKFLAEREGIAREYGLDTAEYSAANEDFYGARRDNRQATIQERSAVNAANRNSQMRGVERGWSVEDRDAGFAQQDKDREDNQAYTTQRDTVAHQRQIETMQMQARIATQQAVEEARAKASLAGKAKMDAYFSTAHGTKAYNEATDRINRAAGIAGDVQEFLRINKDQETGSALDRSALGSAVGGWLDTEKQQMWAIAQRIAPTLREAGSGAMSDKDVEMYRQSIPNPGNRYEANKAIGERLIKGAQRMQDFENQKLTAMAQGNQVEFSSQWAKYISEVSIDTGVTFEQWKNAPKLKGRR